MTTTQSRKQAIPQQAALGSCGGLLAALGCAVTLLVVCRPVVAQAPLPATLNVVEHGADPTGATDCTDLLTRLHATGKPVFYPNGIYRFNGPHLDLSGGVSFESADTVVVRNDISAANILQFDDGGHLVGLQHNHLEHDQSDLGGPAPIDIGNLVHPPLSTSEHETRADLLVHWYNDFGLEHRRANAPDLGWIGWYYWSWNFHDADRDGYDPARHPLLGFYRGDDPAVLDWQCYWLHEYGVRGVILMGPSQSNALASWQPPDHRNHWIYQLFTHVPNFRKLNYVMTAYTPYAAASDEQRAKVEHAWESLIDDVYLQHDNFYAIRREGKVFPVLYLHEEAALRGVFDNYSGGANTAAFYRRIAKLFQQHGYAGVALLARHPISNRMVDFDSLEGDGVLHFVAHYAVDHSSGDTYAARVDSYDPPVHPKTLLSVCTAKHTHTPHPSKWVCPGHSPALFGEMLRKAVSHIEEHEMPRMITCYNVAEWAEGGPGLQPNMQDRFGYLEAVRDALVVPSAQGEATPQRP